MRVEIHVEELVLHGFPASERHAVGRAVEQELARLVAERGLPESLTAPTPVAHVDGGEFPMASGAMPRAVGQAIARSVYGEARR